MSEIKKLCNWYLAKIRPSHKLVHQSCFIIIRYIKDKITFNNLNE